MIAFDETFWFAICFFIFCFLAYRPIRNFIVSILDLNIAKVQKEFILANKILESSKINLKESQDKLDEAMLESEKILKNSAKSIDLDLKHIHNEFEGKLKKLYSNNEEMIKNLNSLNVLQVKNEIIEHSFRKLTHHIEISQQ